MSRPPEEHPVVVVTGAGAGVGRAIVREFARRHKARMGLVSRDPGRLAQARKEVEEAGGQAIDLPCDVADADAVDRVAQTVEDRLGPIDIWVNDAMVSMLAPFKEMEMKEFHRITEVTYLGYVHGTHAALKRMLPRDRGVILQVGSALAYRSIPLQSAYCGAKHAIVGFTEALRTELLHDGSHVQVKMVQLPAVNTPQFDWMRNRMPGRGKPVGRIYQPEVAADAIVWTAYHDRPEVDLGYTTVEAIMADRIAPRLADHWVKRMYDQQNMPSIPDPPGRPDNLYDAVPGDYAARGAFSDEAMNFSPQMWANKNRGKLLGAVALLATAGAAYAMSRRHEVSTNGG